MHIEPRFHFKSAAARGAMFFTLTALLTVKALAQEPSVFVIPIHGDIEPSTAVFVRRHSEAALRGGARVLVFDIDTFGGRVDSALRISSYIGSVRDVKTVAFVRSRPDGMGVSWSAGALIALSCSSLYMAPGTSIGAAAPVTVGADGQTQKADEKSVSAVRAQMAALAEKNGYPAAIALAMVDEDVELHELTVDGKTRVATEEETVVLERADPEGVRRIKVISAKGKLLSLTAGEAELYGLSSGTVPDVNALAEALGAAGPVKEIEPSAADRVIVFLTSSPVQSLLILLGLIALFLEINSPGFGVPGTVAIIAFLILFGANALMGTVGSLEIILFLVGVALLLVEIFLLPGFGVAGVSGILLIGIALVLSMQDFVRPSVPWERELLGKNVLTVVVGLVLAIGAIGVLALAGPRIKLFDRLMLKTTIWGTAGGILPPDEEAASPVKPLEGKEGLAHTTLRPSGKAIIEGRLYSVETEGTFLESGTPIKVLYVQGNRIVVGPSSLQAKDKSRG